MKLRYYLRGLGVGILVTAIIMGVASWGQRETLSDAQIRERALKMGMVDGSSPVLSDLQSGPNASGGTKPTSPIIPEDDPTTSTNLTKESTPPTSSKEPATPANPTKESTTPTNPTKESTTPTSSAKEPATTPTSTAKNPTTSSNSSQPTVTIVIKGGSGSEAVSRTLAEAGLVPDAKAYDQYLCDNGYSKGLRAGTYEIPEGASEEEIANMIATKR